VIVAGAREASIGIQLPTVDGFRRGYVDLRPTARRAEEVGLDSLWVGDHLVANAPIVESVVAVATAVAVTERIRVGFAVLLAAMRQPAWLAKQLSSLQAVSGGRIEVGVGVGGEIPAEWAAAEVPVRERGRRTDALLSVLPELLSGRTVQLPEPWQVEVPPLEPHGPTPPLWVGGRTDVALRRAVRHRAGWMGLWADEQRLRNCGERLREIAAELSAPVPTMGVQVLVHPCADGTRGQAETADFMEQVYRIPFAKLSRYALTGGTDAIAERLAGLVTAGAGTVVMIPALRDYLPHMDELGAIADAVRARLAGTVAVGP
jgi:alkanesulfonate monooxygenase SsuD/methylene tetrahydromethanopterin reductase-like flavin-dependent oxidoreductase (luciferase family)